jgi:hypothetical protein
MSGRPRHLAFKSQSAASTAEMALAQIPREPRLRTAANIRSQALPIANASAPDNKVAKTSLIRLAACAPA